MRIALFTETFLPHVDGVVTRLTQTITHLRDMGDEVLVIAPSQPDLPDAYAGARVIGLPSAPSVVYKDFRLAAPALTREARAALVAFRPDITHVADPLFAGLAGVRFARRHGLPLIASYHTHVPMYARRYRLGFLEGVAWRYIQTLHRKAALTLCTSPSAEAMVRAHGLERVARWLPGVDTALFNPAQRSSVWRERLTGGKQAGTVLLVVGRLAAEKSLDRLAPALARLPDCHLALVGAGPAEADLRRAFAGLPVTFVGTLQGADLAAAYASADIFAQPSSTETLGLTVLEAMASGLPVVGARRGGIPDLVREGETGLLFDPDMPGELDAALARLATSPDQRAHLGQAARRYALEQGWAAATAGLRAYYRRVIQAHAAAAPVRYQALPNR